ncbi:multidrug efflux RND transporter permease subunit [Aquirhabdus sp.]|uniref:multidrug efflux RND transporter permease subunit n=1 Tax=Aquirhabdus sp. TaxID=2824160 RepID=UPI00396C7CA7
MSFSAIFIKRAVATTLLSFGIALSGIVAFNLLPVSPLPQVDYPTISVQASLPGASPETMASTVATPLERSLGRIAGITEMTSSSSLGSTRVTLQFDLNRDIDGAARDVQAAINAARSLLPSGMPSNPSYRKVNPADAPVMILALTSKTMSQGQMYDAASTILAQKIAQVQGVGQVSVGGSSLPAVRVELNPTALNKYGIALETVRTTLAGANANRPKGSLEKGDQHWQIYASDQAKTAQEYIPLIISYNNGNAVRLSDVASVTDSVENIRNAGMSAGEPSVLVIINRQPGANILETVQRIRDLLPQMQASMPAAIDVKVANDRTPTIRASLESVEETLIISIGLVIMVVFIFLRNGRATLIPSMAVPISLLGTFSIMYMAGFSLNNLSLMALTVATGFVVDDAIVVLENITRHIEEGMEPMAAALQGAREVSFTVVSMSISLIAVFIPILMMGGIIGRLFHEFAVTLSAAILVSLVVSLTLTPMMCSRLLRPIKEKKPNGKLFQASENFFNYLLDGYRRSLAWALVHRGIMLLILLITVGLNVYLYVIVPKGFFPQQDTGRLMGQIQGDQSISFQAMRQKLQDFMLIVKKDPDVDTVVGFTGGGQVNGGNMFIALKPLSERTDNADAVIARLRKKLAHEPGATLFLQAVQDIRVGGRASQAQYQYTLQADDIATLNEWAPKIQAELAKSPVLADVNTDQQGKGSQTTLVMNRDELARLNLTVSQVDSTLNDAFGQRQVSTIYMPLNQYHVVMEVAPEYWQSPEALKSIYMITSSGKQVPLSAVAHYEPTFTSLTVNHQGQFVATTISFNLPQGKSLSDATAVINDTMARLGVPTSVHGSFQGNAKAFQDSLNSQPMLILAALLTMYIVLGVLYESYIHPITILSTLPSAGVGALLALMLFNTEFSIIALIAILLLIGIVKKNAIMMIDFALQAQRQQGLSARDAIYEACQLRFRPIMMTTMAAMLGAVPLALGHGDGAEMRQPLGIAIVGGLILSQLLTLYTTPIVFIGMDSIRQRVLRWRGQSDVPPKLANPH